MSDTIKQQIIKQETLDKAFLTGPGEDIVQKLLYQFSQIKPFVDLFGPYPVDSNLRAKTDQMRWADYDRGDWSLRQLPTISVFESQAESKQSDNAFVTGTISIAVYWPASMRRGDWARVPVAFAGAIKNFFASKWGSDMLDEHVSAVRPAKVAGLNELGKEITWTPNAFGRVETSEVPATMIDVRYRVDLRAWYRAMEAEGRTKDDPFDVTLKDLVGIDAKIMGLDPGEDDQTVVFEIDSSMNVNS